ncbi:MAG: hypothetical protein E6J61_01290 [Deltaproteobacteria bacterium]|nr:MAG: hypothetical protein E6J61_01290 [Deltaproteobacteria bacterium]
MLIGAMLQALPARAGQVPDAPVQEPPYRLRVHLLSPDEAVELHRLAGRDRIMVCKAPCDTEVSFRAADRFAIDGPGLLRSAAFHLPARDGEAAFRVTPEYTAPMQVAGILGGAAGFAFLYGGIGYLGEAALGGVSCDGEAPCLARHQSDQNHYRVVALIGLGVTIASAAFVIWGSLHPTRVVPDAPADGKQGP